MSIKEIKTEKRPYFRSYFVTGKIGNKKFKPGLWHHTTKEKDGETHNIDIWVCSPLQSKAIASYGESDFGRLIKYKNVNGNIGEWCAPMTMLSGSSESMRLELLRLGVLISQKHRPLLADYLMEHVPKRQVIAATSTGWHDHDGNRMFILPQLVIGDGDVCFQSETAASDDYSTNGTMAGWSSTVGAACVGNPAVRFAVSVAFAGPLLKIVNKSGGGFNFVNRSSKGKTSLLRAACSVWGARDGEINSFMRQWDSTKNGLEGLSAARNDTCLILDELGTADARNVGTVIYSITGGMGRQRANQLGAAKAIRRWRNMLLSSGEVSLTAKMAEAGQTPKAGQLVRLIDIPIQRRCGVFDSVSTKDDGARLSDAIGDFARDNFGHAGPEFVRCLAELEPKVVREQYREICDKFKTTHSQEHRSAEMFALVALAGEIAITGHVVPGPPGSATDAAIEMFKAWHGEQAAGDNESTQTLEKVAAFVDANAHRFESKENGSSVAIRDRAGWYAPHGLDGDTRIWMFTTEALKEATAGLDFKLAGETLDEAGWLVAKDSKRLAKNTRIDGEGSKRLYHVVISEIAD